MNNRKSVSKGNDVENPEDERAPVQRLVMPRSGWLNGDKELNLTSGTVCESWSNLVSSVELPASPFSTEREETLDASIVDPRFQVSGSLQHEHDGGRP